MLTDPVPSPEPSISRRMFFGGCAAVVAGVVVAACGSDGAAQPVADPAGSSSAGSSGEGSAGPSSSSTAASTGGDSVASGGPRIDGVTIDVRRDPGCGCCLSWVSYLEELGATVNVSEDAKRVDYRAELGVPEEARSCHTGLVEGYAVEGHVPAEAIIKMIADKPTAAGIAVPGMPGDSPGMGGDAATWAAQKVMLIGTDGSLTDYIY